MKRSLFGAAAYFAVGIALCALVALLAEKPDENHASARGAVAAVGEGGES